MGDCSKCEVPRDSMLGSVVVLPSHGRLKSLEELNNSGRRNNRGRVEQASLFSTLNYVDPVAQDIVSEGVQHCHDRIQGRVI